MTSIKNPKNVVYMYFSGFLLSNVSRISRTNLHFRYKLISQCFGTESCWVLINLIVVTWSEKLGHLLMSSPLRTNNSCLRLKLLTTFAIVRILRLRQVRTSELSCLSNHIWRKGDYCGRGGRETWVERNDVTWHLLTAFFGDVARCVCALLRADERVGRLYPSYWLILPLPVRKSWLADRKLRCRHHCT